MQSHEALGDQMRLRTRSNFVHGFTDVPVRIAG